MTIQSDAEYFIREANINKENDFSFQKATLKPFSDVSLNSGNLYEMYKIFGNDRGLDHTFSNENRVIILGNIEIASMKQTNIFFSGSKNTVHIENLTGVSQLNIACIEGSRVSIKAPSRVRGVTVMSSHGSRISIGSGCLFSRDILLYASKAHGMYNVVDGSSRLKDTIEIGDRVWIGQGVRILAGAKVGDGSVIGSYSVLAGRIPNNCAAAGNPCRVTTKDIFWTNKAAPDDGNYFDMLKGTGKSIPSFVQYTKE